MKTVRITAKTIEAAVAEGLKQLGISRVIAQVLPQDKEREVRRLQEEGHKVAMVGVDATSKQQEAIKNGQELGVLSQNPYAMGYQTMWAAIQSTAPKKETKIEKQVLLDPAWIDAENLGSEDYANYMYN